ncbi:DUF5610 domain-containing protein [Vibrio sp. 2-Bac 85]
MQINSRQTYVEVEQSDKNPKNESVAANNEPASTESLQQINKKQLNAAILQSAIDQSNKTSSSIKDQPLALVLKTALQGINDALKEIEPTQSLQQSYESEVDFSPEATAERIVTFSTNFFNAYQEQHPELDPQQARDTFADLMLEGVEEGIGEAKDILKALSVLEGDVEQDIDLTMSFILEGFEKFRNPEPTVESEAAESKVV